MSDQKIQLEKLVKSLTQLAEALFEAGRIYERDDMARKLGLLGHAPPASVKLNGHARAKSNRKFGEIAGAVRSTVGKHGTGSIPLQLLIRETQASPEGEGLTDRQLRAAIKSLVSKGEIESAGRARYRATARLHKLAEVS